MTVDYNIHAGTAGTRNKQRVISLRPISGTARNVLGRRENASAFVCGTRTTRAVQI